MFPGSANLGKFGKQLGDMRKRFDRLREDLKDRVVEAASGGGMVKVKVSGTLEVVDVEIEPEVITATEKGMLEDLVLAAVNEGIRKASRIREVEMAKLTGTAISGFP